MGHVTPEAFEGGLIGLINDGDTITIDAVNNEINVKLDESEIQARRDSWERPPPYVTHGALAKYARLVTSASEGAVTDKYLST